MNESRKPFPAAYFDKSAVLRLAHWAGILAWVILGVYIFTSAVTFIQFMSQFVTGVFYQKGMSIFDLISFFHPHLMQPLPGVVYFFGLKFVEHGLLILMEMEESARRAARNAK